MTEINPEDTTSETDEAEPDLNLSVKKYAKYFDILRRNDAPMTNGLPSLEMIANLTEPIRRTTFRDKLIVNYVPIVGNEERIPEVRQNMHELTARMRGRSNPECTKLKGESGYITIYMPEDTLEDRLNEFFLNFKKHYNSWMIIKNIYDGINLDEQDENTGKAILEKNKLLIDQFHLLIISALGKILWNPKSPINLPQELYELRKLIYENSITYGNLPAVKTYEKVGRAGTIYARGVPSKNRSEWFEAGKPTPKEWFDKWIGVEKDEVE